MGFEALSLGFASIHLCEIDKKRLEHLDKIQEHLKRCFLSQEDQQKNIKLKEVKLTPFLEKIKVYRRDFRRMCRLIQEHSPSVLYLDLPYCFWQGQTKNPLGLENFFLKLGQKIDNGCFSAWIFVQGPAFFQAKRLKFIRPPEFRRYGKQHLSFWLQENPI